LLQSEAAAAEERIRGDDSEARHEDVEAGVPSSEAVREPRAKRLPRVPPTANALRCERVMGFYDVLNTLAL
jgi:hypothetical protein